MALFVWDEKYSVNVAEFNGHHKRLIDLINELGDAMSSGKGREVLGKILDSLAEYTKMHFQAEEKLMIAKGYKGYDEHKKEHDRFVAQVVDLKGKLAVGSLSVTLETMNFLKKWLTGHIMGIDKKYTAFFNEKGIV